jgi:hypothetical protein
MYWSDIVAGMIERANLDGSDAEVLVTGLNGPAGIALDLSAPVPEPGTLQLLGIGTMALVGYTWRHRKKNAHDYTFTNIMGGVQR